MHLALDRLFTTAQNSIAARFKSQSSDKDSLAAALTHHDAERHRRPLGMDGVWLWLWFPYLNTPEQHRAGELISAAGSVKNELNQWKPDGLI